MCFTKTTYGTKNPLHYAYNYIKSHFIRINVLHPVKRKKYKNLITWNNILYVEKFAPQFRTGNVDTRRFLFLKHEQFADFSRGLSHNCQ